jgi:hypothetical protein
MKLRPSIEGPSVKLALATARGGKVRVVPEAGDHLLNEVLPIGDNLTDESDNQLTA